MQVSISSRESSGFVHSVCFKNANSSALADSFLISRNKSITFATQNLRRVCKVVQSGKKLFLIDFVAPSSTAQKIRWSHMGKYAVLWCNVYLCPGVWAPRRDLPSARTRRTAVDYPGELVSRTFSLRFLKDWRMFACISFRQYWKVGGHLSSGPGTCSFANLFLCNVRLFWSRRWR